MDKLEEFQTAAVAWLKKMSEQVKVHWKAFLIAGLALVLVFLLIAVVIPNAQRTIRVKEVAALVEKDVKNVKQVETVAYDGLDKLIRKEKKLSILLVDPNDANYATLIKALNDTGKMSQYPDKLYFYPVVYDKKNIEKKYNLTSGITVISFEDLVEVERTELVETKEIELYLVDHLNSLSRGTVVKGSEAEKTTESTAESTTASSIAEEDEPIEELQNLGENQDGQ